MIKMIYVLIEIAVMICIIRKFLDLGDKIYTLQSELKWLRMRSSANISKKVSELQSLLDDPVQPSERYPSCIEVGAELIEIDKLDTKITELKARRYDELINQAQEALNNESRRESPTAQKDDQNHA